MVSTVVGRRQCRDGTTTGPWDRKRKIKSNEGPASVDERKTRDKTRQRTSEVRSDIVRLENGGEKKPRQKSRDRQRKSSEENQLGTAASGDGRIKHWQAKRRTDKSSTVFSPRFLLPNASIHPAPLHFQLSSLFRSLMHMLMHNFVPFHTQSFLFIRGPTAHRTVSDHVVL